jgi:hypothetical protein
LRRNFRTAEHSLCFLPFTAPSHPAVSRALAPAAADALHLRALTLSTPKTKAALQRSHFFAMPLI